MGHAQELAEYLSGVDSLAVVCHDHPDPDCIASGLALCTIAEENGVSDVDLLYGAVISHQQNRAFVNLLDVQMTRIADADMDEYDRLAFVDHAVPGAHTELDADMAPDIVIDHHPLTEPIEAPFVDVREEMGATMTILVEYLSELDIGLDTRLASAALFALHRECIDFIRHPTVEEYAAARHVCQHADLELLDRLYGAAFSPATIDAVGEAIRRRTQRGASLVTCVGRTSERDALAQAADYLLNVEGVDTVLVFGIVDDEVELSARSIDPRTHVGDLLREAFGDVGSAGGHADMAGAQIPLGLFVFAGDDDADELVAFVSRRVTERFFDALNLNDES